jgi:hypothetical protein
MTDGRYDTWGLGHEEEGTLRWISLTLGFMVLALNLVVCLLFAHLVWWLHRPYASRPGSARWWLLAVVLLGIPGWIAYKILRPRDSLLSCPQCGRLRSVANERCPFCLAIWPAAVAADTDVIDTQIDEPVDVAAEV